MKQRAQFHLLWRRHQVHAHLCGAGLWHPARAGHRQQHTDAEREWAYDRQSSIGRLDKGIDEAQARGWTVVSMKDDWKTIFPP
jgi:hypothetical protein